MAAHDIRAIDLVVVNLYPFRETVAKPGCTLDDAIENIDIGGPAMVRAAAKNHGNELGGVGIVTDPDDYARRPRRTGQAAARCPTRPASSWRKRPSRIRRATTRRSPTG